MPRPFRENSVCGPEDKAAWINNAESGSGPATQPHLYSIEVNRGRNTTVSRLPSFYMSTCSPTISGDTTEISHPPALDFISWLN